MPKAQKHCKLHDFYAWTVPKKQEKWPKIDQKTPNKNLQNASSNFTLFFPTPNPQKRENPSRLKDFRGGSAAGARPRVAKAMLSFPHYTARHRRIKGCRPCRRPRTKKEVCRRRDDIWPSRFQNFAASRASFAALGALGTLVTLNGTIQFVSQDGDM